MLPIAAAQDKASKAEEHLKEINLLFKKLKVIYKNLQPIPNVNDDQGGLLLDIDMTEVNLPIVEMNKVFVDSVKCDLHRFMGHLMIAPSTAGLVNFSFFFQQDLIPMKRKADADGEPDVDEIMRKKKFESQAYMQVSSDCKFALAEVLHG